MADLKEVNEAIDRMGLRWEARDSEIAKNIATENFGGYGFSPAKRPPKGSSATNSARFQRGGPPEDEFDWRDVDGTHWLTEVKDQGNCGACVAFAICSTLEARYRIEKDNATESIDLSEAELFFCGNKVDDPCREGWDPRVAMQRCKAEGVGYEREFPYATRPRKIDERCSGITDRMRIGGFRRIEDFDQRRVAISERGPVVGSMYVYADFGFYSDGVYRPTTANARGLHSVSVVGYSDLEGCWIVQNSWGKAWGNDGYFKIGYGTCGIDSEFEFLEPSSLIPKLGDANA